MTTKPLTAQDMRDARNRYLDASAATVKAREASRFGNHTRLADALNEEEEAKAAFESVRVQGTILEAQERAAQHEQARQATLAQEQAALSAQREADAKAQARTKYLVAGGTVEKFEEAWPGMFSQLLRRETLNAMRLTGEDDTINRLRTNPMYHSL